MDSIIDLQCGLDKARQAADMATQERLFRQQLRLGKELDRPISVSCTFYIDIRIKLSMAALMVTQNHVFLKQLHLGKTLGRATGVALCSCR